ncbi:MAG: hypothetical protein ACE5Q6_01060, partial [Dehalococcoidia bacterium]
MTRGTDPATAFSGAIPSVSAFITAATASPADGTSPTAPAATVTSAPIGVQVITRVAPIAKSPAAGFASPDSFAGMKGAAAAARAISNPTPLASSSDPYPLWVDLL